MGENINFQNEKGNSLLHICILEDNVRMAYLLLVKNCDINLKNEFGETGYDVAVKIGNERIQGLFVF